MVWRRLRQVLGVSICWDYRRDVDKVLLVCTVRSLTEQPSLRTKAMHLCLQKESE